MRSSVRFALITALAGGLVQTAVPAAHASNFVGDLVYCDVDANGVFDGADYELDGVEVRVTCRDQEGVTCFDTTATTGVLHPSVDPAGLDILCGPVTGISSSDLHGRYVVETLGVNAPGCVQPELHPGPYVCTVAVNEATLPETCDGLVTPVAGLPADTTGDGDWCDLEDGPFPEGQALGNQGMPGATCEAAPSPGPSEGVHRTLSAASPLTTCSLYADFGYRPRERGGATRTPGFWKNHPEATAALLPVELCGRMVTEVCDAVGLLSAQGGGLKAFTRHAVAASLNCAAFGCSADIAEVIAEGSAACARDAEYDFETAATLLDEFNNSGTMVLSGLDQSSADPELCRGSNSRNR
jgi:hypothetical protein